MTKKIKPPESCNNPKDMINWVESQGLHHKRTTGGHAIYGTDKGSVPISTHEELSPQLRKTIKKQVLAIVALGLVLLAFYLWNNCPPVIYDFIFA